MLSLSRWELHKFDSVNNKIIIFDHLSKRQKSYYVPNSTHVILKDSSLYVTTLGNKIMKVCLHNGSRKILLIKD